MVNIMMEIRPYSSKDAETVCRLWNDSLVHDQINIDNFYQKVIYDVNFDPGKLLVAEQDGKALGFVYATMRRFPDEVAGLQADQAWIVAFGVEPSARRKGAGRILLSSIEEKLCKEGAKKIDVGPYPNNYFSPGIDKNAYSSGVDFFLAHGYLKTSECCAMHLNLRGYETPPKYVEKKKALEAEGYRFKAYEAADALSLFAFAKEHFPYWLSNLRTSILAGRAGETLIVAQEASGATAGFVMRNMDGSHERFGPFATRPSLQGKGIGTVLFHEMMKNMVRERIFYTYFLWTSGRNLDIYATWDMSIFRTFSMISRTLP